MKPGTIDKLTLFLTPVCLSLMVVTGLFTRDPLFIIALSSGFLLGYAFQGAAGRLASDRKRSSE